MPETRTIRRSTGVQEQGSFEELKRQGIGSVQELAGDLWTDYNLHDPGVTILEQLCYGLTDLIYRTGFPVEDLLAGQDGSLECDRLALHPAERIFPCRPTTIDDYRTAIFDAVPEIDNVWLTTVEGPYGPLLRVVLRLKERSEGAEHRAMREEIRARVSRGCSSSRNLCEDLEEIVFVREISCVLHGEIEIGAGRPATEILSELYHLCSRSISGGISSRGYEEALRQGVEPEEIFRGPLTRFGFIRDDDLDDARDEIRVSDLYSVIRSIDGVENITSLFLESGGRTYHSGMACEGAETAVYLNIPESDGEIRVQLTRSGRRVVVSARELEARYGELDFARRSMRHAPQDLSAIAPLPHGEFRDLGRYVSIQNQFPAIYGIGRFGVAESASPRRRGAAAQLKGYLLPFEQLMANFLANQGNLRTLFSIESSPQRTYWHQTLEESGIADLERVYPEQAEASIAALVEKHDNVFERKNRLLDYLLALYGERVSPSALRDFSSYHPPQETERIAVRQKAAFLNQIVELGRDRGEAPDYGAAGKSGAGVSGLHRRVSLMLGFGSGSHRSLTRPILSAGFILGDDSAFSGTEPGLPVPAEEPGNDSPWFQVPLSGPDGGTPEELRPLTAGICFTDSGRLTPSLLQRGVALENYRIAPQGTGTQLLFAASDSGKWWRIGLFPDQGSAVTSANALRRLLVGLSLGSEGMHVVEHILLRPRGTHGREDGVPADFFPFRVSVLFPAWTARCGDRNFRRLAEETVQRNCPAHILAECHWLRFDRMAAFEQLYTSWTTRMHRREPGDPELERTSRALVRFLLDTRSREGEGDLP